MATCPVTEMGFVRVSSKVRVIPDARTPAEAISLLAEIRRLPDHTFWDDDISPADPQAEAFSRIAGHRQGTDAHLLTLALRNGGCVATFDRGVAELVPEGVRNAGELIPQGSAGGSRGERSAIRPAGSAQGGPRTQECSVPPHPPGPSHALAMLSTLDMRSGSLRAGTVLQVPSTSRHWASVTSAGNARSRSR